MPPRESSSRRNGQFTTLPPGTQREPITRSASCERVEKQVELLGLVGPVGVHLADHVVAGVEGHPEAVLVRRPQAALLRAVQDLHGVVTGRELVGDLAGAVG